MKTYLMDEEKVPTKLTIVGNGFDLAIKARTSYERFYHCLKECFRANNPDDFRKRYFRKNNKPLVESFYELVKNNEKNYFINYFLEYEVVFGSWVSFEKELTKIIKAFDDLVSYLNSSERACVPFDDGYPPLYVRMADNRNLIQVLNVYPDNRFFNAKIKGVIFIGQAVVPFSIKEKKCKTRYELFKHIEDFSERFPSQLFADLTVFSNLFSLYLGIVDHYVRFDSVVQDFFDSSFFINYNFTDYLDRLMKENGLFTNSILYINGLAKNIDGEPKEKIVFGIDSDTKLSNSQFEVFTKRIQRSIKDTGVSRLDNLLRHKFDEIYVIGHSLNIADYESLRFIFSKCEKTDKPKIIVFYYDDEAKINLIVNLKTILGKEKFDEYQREGLLKFSNSRKAWVKLK